MAIALGIDASLSATALAAVPFNWGLDWSRVRRATVGRKLDLKAPLAERVARIEEIVDRTRVFCAVERADVVFLEDYAFDQAQRAHSLGELGGQLKRLLIKELGLDVRLVAATAARKLLGKMPRKGAKDEAHIRLTTAGAPLEWTRDELDAFLAANWGLSGIKGADALILRTAEDDAPKAKKQRRKAA